MAISINGGALATARYAGHTAICALLLTVLWTHADRAGLLDAGVGRALRTASF